MSRLITLVFLVFIMSLSVSCGQQSSPKKEKSTSVFINAITTDTLSFKSGINTIFQDSKANYWLGSHQEGVAKFDGESFEYLTTKQGLADNHIKSIQEDHNGKLWFESAKAISSFDGKSITNHLKSEQVNAPLYWTKSKHDLWFSADHKNGVYQYDGQHLNYLAFSNLQSLDPNMAYAVTSISKGQNEWLWLGTYASVFGYNGSELYSINNESLGLDPKIEPLHVRSILEDSKGRLWIGNNGIGVLLKEGDSILNFSEQNNLIHSSKLRRGAKSPPGTLEHVFSIEEDSKGHIWFGDRDTGVWKYDGNTIKNYRDNLGIPNHFVFDIYRDNKDIMWFVLTNGSILRFNGKSFDRVF